MTKIKSRKQELKLLSLEIRSLKQQRKPLKGQVPNLCSKQYQFRKKHIAYCLARGRQLNEIEVKNRPDNLLSSYELDQIRLDAEQLLSIAEVSNCPKVESK